MAVRGKDAFRLRSGNAGASANRSRYVPSAWAIGGILFALHLVFTALTGLADEVLPVRGSVDDASWGDVDDSSHTVFRSTVLPVVFTNGIDTAELNPAEAEVPPMPTAGLSDEVDSLRRLTADLTKRLNEATAKLRTGREMLQGAAA